MARNNSKVCDCEGSLEFVLGDFLHTMKRQVDLVFLHPKIRN